MSHAKKKYSISSIIKLATVPSHVLLLKKEIYFLYTVAKILSWEESKLDYPYPNVVATIRGEIRESN